MWRHWTLAFVLIIAGIGYFALLHHATQRDLPSERHFGSFGANEAGARVYIEPLSIDAAGDSIRARVSVMSGDAGVESPSSASEQDFSLLLGHDESVRRIEVRAGEPAPEVVVDLDLGGGDISDYPLDAYHAELWLRAVSPPKSPGAAAESIPLQVTVWERVLGFRLQTRELPKAVAGESNLAFDIRRGLVVEFFVLAAYVAMALLGLGALTVGALVFLGARKPEATLMGALAGMVFALPTLRNALPGGAPLGVSADIFVFLWAELMAVGAITMLIVTWARSGPKP
jgi:hypothetical protein